MMLIYFQMTILSFSFSGFANLFFHILKNILIDRKNLASDLSHFDYLSKQIGTGIFWVGKNNFEKLLAKLYSVR